MTLTVADSAGQTSAVSHLVTISSPASSPPPPPAPAPPATPPPPTPPPTHAPFSPATCTVPNVKGKSLTAAQRALAARGCSVGRVTRARKPKHGPGNNRKWMLVVSREAPVAGNTRPRGSKIALTLVWKAVKK